MGGKGEQTTDTIDAVMIGAGNRGHRAYGQYAAEHLRDRLRFVAVAEPGEDRRARFAELHGIPPSRQSSGASATS